MSHARVEELSDSDPDIDDLSNVPFPASSSSIIAPADIPSSNASSSNAPPPPQPPLSSSSSSFAPATTTTSRPSRETIKNYSTLYPIYFDASRSRAEGRRVSSKLAVPNPLARDIAEACKYIAVSTTDDRLKVAFEPEKTHPKDWANPGRVRVGLRDLHSSSSSSATANSSSGFGSSNASPRTTTTTRATTTIKNKSHLYILVAKYLQADPATKESPLKLRMQGMPVPEKLEPPAVPKGWKINQILPLHSAAMSGGEVSENFFKNMMAEMQDSGSGQGAGQGGGRGGKTGTQKSSSSSTTTTAAAGVTANGGDPPTVNDATGGGGSAKRKKNKKRGR